MNARPVWREDIAAFVPAPGAIPGLHPAGAANGVFSTAACLADGIRAATAALDGLGLKAPPSPRPRPRTGPTASNPAGTSPARAAPGSTSRTT
jgi:hypothetical protein